jgi:hypothetical protein
MRRGVPAGPLAIGGEYGSCWNPAWATAGPSPSPASGSNPVSAGGAVGIALGSAVAGAAGAALVMTRLARRRRQDAEGPLLSG